MSDLPFDLPREVVARFGHAFDTDGRLAAALDATATLAGREVLLLDTPADGVRARQLRARGAIVTAVPSPALDRAAAPADTVVGLWSSLAPGDDAAELAALRLVRPGGALIAVHDYGRDDMAELTATPETPDASTRPVRPEAPFLQRGWKIRVIHCFWTFNRLDEARSFAEAFGAPGLAMASRLQRSRISHNLALYHRPVPAS